MSRRRTSRSAALWTLVTWAFARSVCGAPAHPNLLLVTIDTTRADHLGCYGWSFARTPNLDALASRGVRFERCDTAAPITLPSHTTILTGLFPTRHGVRDNGTFALDPKVETVATRLAAAGYDTAAVVSAIILARRHGLARGFRIYDDDLGAGFSTGTLVAERTADETVDAALRVLATLKPPYFLWVHFFDPHEEYRPPSRFADSIGGPNRLYDGEIAFVDEQFGRLLAALPRETATIVVGDHGEMLGEHGELTHGLLLFRGARRVPLILAGAGVPAGRVESCLARTADVAPTLLDLGGAAAPSGLDGTSLLSLAGSGGCERTSYTESFLPFFAYKWYPLRALSDGDSLFLQAPRPSLYRLGADPGEEHDVILDERRLAKSYRDRLGALLAAASESLTSPVRTQGSLSAEQRAALASLGYLSGGAGGEVSDALPDPRDRTGVAQAIHEAAAQVQQGRCAEALPALRKIVDAEPHNFPALSLWGECLRDTGKPAEALAAFGRAAGENEMSAVPVASVAGSLLALGRESDAEKEYRHALALDPSQAESAANLARLLRGRGAAKEALAVLDAAVAAGCLGPEVFRERGTARAEAGRIEEALGDFREAARRNPRDVVALENAARSAYRLARHRESAQLYQTLLRIAPTRGDVWKTLGAIELYELGDRAAAESAFREAVKLEKDPAERARLEAILADLAK